MQLAAGKNDRPGTNEQCDSWQRKVVIPYCHFFSINCTSFWHKLGVQQWPETVHAYPFLALNLLFRNNPRHSARYASVSLQATTDCSSRSDDHSYSQVVASLNKPRKPRIQRNARPAYNHRSILPQVTPRSWGSFWTARKGTKEVRLRNSGSKGSKWYIAVTFRQHIVACQPSPGSDAHPPAVHEHHIEGPNQPSLWPSNGLCEVNYIEPHNSVRERNGGTLRWHFC